MPSRPGITTSERIKSKRSAFASSRARAALSQTVASCPARRNARASDASVFASSSMIRMWAFSGTRAYAPSPAVASGFSDAVGSCVDEALGRCAGTGRSGGLAGRRMWNDVPTPVSLSTDMRPPWSLTTDCTIAKAQPRAVLLGRVVRREKPLALLRRQSAAGVGDFEFHVTVLVRRAQHQHSARRHRVHGVEHQVLNRAVQQRARPPESRAGFLPNAARA